MPEIDAGILMTLAIAVNVPTWTMIAWILKVQRDTCQRLSVEETKSAIYHKK